MLIYPVPIHLELPVPAFEVGITNPFDSATFLSTLTRTEPARLELPVSLLGPLY
jgi:hypothetical protein